MTDSAPVTGSARGATPRTAASTLELLLALVLLAIASAIGCVLCAAWLSMWRVGIPFPFTALVAGAWSLFLVWVASAWSDSKAVAAFPALTFIVTLIALDLGPGGDMPVAITLRGLALLTLGGLLPLWVAVYGRKVAPGS